MERSLVELTADIAAHHPRLSRRDLLELAALASALVACRSRSRDAAPAPSPGPASAAGDAGAAASALDARAYRALEAATARILPATPTFPGARGAGVMGFIDRQLTIPPLARIAPALTTLARALDQRATSRGAPDFATLDAPAQDALLDELARGAWADEPLPQRALFQVLHGLTLEGFLADPVHGGNRDGVGWAAIGFPEPPLRRPGAGGDHHGGHGGGHGG